MMIRSDLRLLLSKPMYNVPSMERPRDLKSCVRIWYLIEEYVGKIYRNCSGDTCVKVNTSCDNGLLRMMAGGRNERW